jgi:hypothetical protein
MDKKIKKQIIISVLSLFLIVFLSVFYFSFEKYLSDIGYRIDYFKYAYPFIRYCNVYLYGIIFSIAIILTIIFLVWLDFIIAHNARLKTWLIKKRKENAQKKVVKFQAIAQDATETEEKEG